MERWAASYGMLYRISVIQYAQTCVVCWADAICTKFVTSVSLRCTIFELYALGLIPLQQVAKSCKSQETAPLMFWLLDLTSVMKCKTVWSHDKPQRAWLALRNLDFHLQKVLRFMAFDATLWKFLETPWKKRKWTSHANWSPKIWRIFITENQHTENLSRHKVW